MTSIPRSRPATIGALAAAAAVSAVALAPAASAVTTEDLPMANGVRQGYLMQPAIEGEITDPLFGGQVPVTLGPGIGCTAPDQTPEGQPREGLFFSTADATVPDQVGFFASLSDPTSLIPTSDRLTVNWTNHDTGESGEVSADGRDLGTEIRVPTGTGHITGTVVLTSEGPLGPIELGSVGGGPHEAHFDFDYTTADCIP